VLHLTISSIWTLWRLGWEVAACKSHFKRKILQKEGGCMTN
jgi:hypothetical protein